MDFVNNIVSEMLSKEENNSWNPFTRKFYRVLLRKGEYGFDRTFQAIGSELEAGMKVTTGGVSEEKMIKLATGKQDRVYEITATIKRIK